MKLFKNLLGSVKPHFEKGGKLEKLYPAYDAFETFLFVPDHTTHKGAHVRDAIDLKTYNVYGDSSFNSMYVVWYVERWLSISFCAIGESASLFENFIFGLEVLPLIIVSYVVGLAVEFAFAIYRGHSVNEGYLVTGLLIPLTMPIDVPLWMLAISVIFAVCNWKGGFWRNWNEYFESCFNCSSVFYFLLIQYTCLETKFGSIMLWLMVTQDLLFWVSLQPHLIGNYLTTHMICFWVLFRVRLVRPLLLQLCWEPFY